MSYYHCHHYIHVHNCAINSPKQYTWDFEFKMFPSRLVVLPKLRRLIFLTIHDYVDVSVKLYIYIYIYIYIYVCVFVCVCVCVCVCVLMNNLYICDIDCSCLKNLIVLCLSFLLTLWVPKLRTLNTRLNIDSILVKQASTYTIHAINLCFKKFTDFFLSTSLVYN